MGVNIWRGAHNVKSYLGTERDGSDKQKIQKDTLVLIYYNICKFARDKIARDKIYVITI